MWKAKSVLAKQQKTSKEEAPVKKVQKRKVSSDEDEEDLEFEKMMRSDDESAEQFEDEEDGNENDEQEEIEEAPVQKKPKITDEAALKKKEEEQQRTKQVMLKQIKSLVNKVSITNLEAISVEMEKLYGTYSRNETNSILTDCIIGTCTRSGQMLTHSVTLIAQSAFLSILHLTIGVEVGASFIERLAAEFETHYKLKKSTECSNLLLLLTHLYNFQTVHCVLVYDVIRKLIGQFTELDLELLLLLLKTCGPQLRSDDPAALKDIILMVQQQANKHGVTFNASDAHEESSQNNKNTNDTASAIKNILNNTGKFQTLKNANENSQKDENNKEEDSASNSFNFRAKFMLQTIYDLKNNKLKSTNTSDDSPSVRTKKAMRAFLAKKGSPSDNPLRISWKDLLDVQNRGRWWLVGSAWAGKEAGDDTGFKAPPRGKQVEQQERFDEKILALAKQQRMNTDVRRAVFCVLMTSDDYLDAFEKVLKLNLKNKQDREIVYVLLHCCAQEKAFNPYYYHLAVKLCTYNKNFKFTIQFAYWDKLKNLSLIPPKGISNLATLLSQLIGGGTLSLTTLKVVEFQKLNPHSILFFRIFFTNLLTKFEETAVRAAFERLIAIKDASSIMGLKEGISYFFLQEELHHASKPPATEKAAEERTMFKKRVRIARKILEKSSTSDVFNF